MSNLVLYVFIDESRPESLPVDASRLTDVHRLLGPLALIVIFAHPDPGLAQVGQPARKSRMK